MELGLTEKRRVKLKDTDRKLDSSLTRLIGGKECPGRSRSLKLVNNTVCQGDDLTNKPYEW